MDRNLIMIQFSTFPYHLANPKGLTDLKNNEIQNF